MLQAVCEAEMALQDTEGPWQQGGNSGLAAAFRRLTVAAAGSVDFRKPTSGAAKTSGFGGLADDVISVIGQRLCGGRSGIARRASEAAAAISALHRRAHACAWAQGLNTLSRQQQALAMANMPDMVPGPHDSKPGRGELRTRVVELLKWTSPDGQSGRPAGRDDRLSRRWLASRRRRRRRQRRRRRRRILRRQGEADRTA